MTFDEEQVEQIRQALGFMNPNEEVSFEEILSSIYRLRDMADSYDDLCYQISMNA